MKKPESIKRAYEFFDKVLRIDPKNYCAAIGIGICFAESGKLDEARSIFHQVSSENLTKKETNIVVDPKSKRVVCCNGELCAHIDGD